MGTAQSVTGFEFFFDKVEQERSDLHRSDPLRYCPPDLEGDQENQLRSLQAKHRERQES